MTACIWNGGDPILPSEYYKPIYSNAGEVFKVSVQNARPLHDPGRIYVKGTLLIINERFEGFHFFDNADPENPKPLLFLKVPGAVNMAIMGSYMYVDNFTDLLTIDISDLGQVKEVNRKKEVLVGSATHPPHENVGFECVDLSRGVVIGWELAEKPSGELECWR